MLKSDEIKAIYPNKVQRKDDSRIYVMNTIFNLAETFLICALIAHFDKKEEYVECYDGWVKNGNLFMFSTLFMVGMHLILKTTKDNIIVRTYELRLMTCT